MKKVIIFAASAAVLGASAIILFRKCKDKKSMNFCELYEDNVPSECPLCGEERSQIIAKALAEYEKFRTDTLQWLEHMLLYNEIELQSIPQSIRISSRSLYIMAFRTSSRKPTPCERFIEDMSTLCEDICSLDNDDAGKSDLVRTFSDYLNINEHKEDEAFVNFEKNLCEEILREMRNRDCASRKTLEEQLKKCGIKW